MHGFILTDAQGCTATNCVSWQDERGYSLMSDGRETCLEAVSRILPYNLTKASGCTPKINQSICPLFYYAQSNDLSGLRFMMMGDYIAYRLTGEIGSCHITNGASTAMADVREGVWSEGICELLGFSRMVLPEIVHEAENCGTYKSTAVYTAVGDQQASILGICDINAEDIIINVATGTQVCALSENFVSGRFETRPYFNGRYILTFPELPSGRRFDAIVDKIAVKDKDKSIEDIWRNINSGMEDIIAEYGLDYSKIDGALEENFEETEKTAYEMLREYLSLAQKISEAIEELPLNEKNRRIVLTGGTVHKSGALVKVIEETLGKKVILPKEKEDCLKGLLKIAQKLKNISK